MNIFLKNLFVIALLLSNFGYTTNSGDSYFVPQNNNLNINFYNINVNNFYQNSYQYENSKKTVYTLDYDNFYNAVSRLKNVLNTKSFEQTFKAYINRNISRKKIKSFLYAASCRGHLEMVQDIIAVIGPDAKDVVFWKSSSGATALYGAVISNQKNKLDIITSLLKAADDQAWKLISIPNKHDSNAWDVADDQIKTLLESYLLDFSSTENLYNSISPYVKNADQNDQVYNIRTLQLCLKILETRNISIHTIKNTNNNTLLHDAIHIKNTKAAKTLLNALNKEEATLLIYERNQTGQNALDLAIVMEDAEFLAFLSEKSGEKKQIPAIIISTPMELSSNKPQETKVKKLSKVNFGEFANEFKALMKDEDYAIFSKVLYELRKKYDIDNNRLFLNFLFEYFNKNYTVEKIRNYFEKACQEAAHNNDLRNINILIDVTDIFKRRIIGKKNSDGNTILHVAVKTGYADLIKLILNSVEERAIPLIAVSNNKNQTAWDIAPGAIKEVIKPYLQNENTIKYLVSFIQAHNKMRKPYFVDTLRNCLRILNVSLCDILIENDRTLLHQAVTHNQLALAEVLLDVAGDDTRRFLNIEESNGFTALDLARYHFNSNMSNLLRNRTK